MCRTHGWVIGLVYSGITQLVPSKIGKFIFCTRGGYAALHKLLGGTGVIGCTAWFFFAFYVRQIWNWCIFIAWRSTRVVCAIVLCLTVWCGCSILAAEWLDLSTVGIAQLAHAAGESIFLPWGVATRLFPNDFGEVLLVWLWCLWISENVDEDDDEDLSPEMKAERERQRRRQNNARERFLLSVYCVFSL